MSKGNLSKEEFIKLYLQADASTKEAANALLRVPEKRPQHRNTSDTAPKCGKKEERLLHEKY